MATRGEHLLKADRGFATGGGLLGRLAAPAFSRVVDQLHERLREGGIHGVLPSGERRRVGFHAAGPEPVVRPMGFLEWARGAAVTAIQSTFPDVHRPVP